MQLLRRQEYADNTTHFLECCVVLLDGFISGIFSFPLAGHAHSFAESTSSLNPCLVTCLPVEQCHSQHQGLGFESAAAVSSSRIHSQYQ